MGYTPNQKPPLRAAKRQQTVKQPIKIPIQKQLYKSKLISSHKLQIKLYFDISHQRIVKPLSYIGNKRLDIKYIVSLQNA